MMKHFFVTYKNYAFFDFKEKGVDKTYTYQYPFDSVEKRSHREYLKGKKFQHSLQYLAETIETIEVNGVKTTFPLFVSAKSKVAETLILHKKEITNGKIVSFLVNGEAFTALLHGQIFSSEGEESNDLLPFSFAEKIVFSLDGSCEPFFENVDHVKHMILNAAKLTIHHHLSQFLILRKTLKNIL